MDNLFDAFVASKPRETSGARTSNAYDYQKDWALCKLLKLHKAESDYVLFLDYHEDIVVFDSSNDPQNADFYQVKQKKSGNWTIASLSKQKVPDELASSILGKMFYSEDIFSEYTNSMAFVSNQGVSCKLKNGNKGLDQNIIQFNELDPADKATVRNAVHSSSAKTSNVAGLRKLCLAKTELGVDTHRNLTVGNLVDFFESIHPGKPIATTLAYCTIFDEIRRKTNNSMTCTNVEELLQLKAITQKDFNAIINQITEHSSSTDLWSGMEAQLRSESYSFADIMRIKKQWQTYLVEQMDANNGPAIKLKSSIRKSLEENDHFLSGNTLKDIIDEMKTKLRTPENQHLYSDEYLKAAIIYEVGTYDSISETSKKPEEKTA